MMRDNGIAVFDKDRVNLCESVQGGINNLMARWTAMQLWPG